MDDVLGYEGKHVVVTGAASGMGEQVARICHELGANVTALDLKPVSTPVKTSIVLDLLDEASIDGVVAADRRAGRRGVQLRRAPRAAVHRPPDGDGQLHRRPCAAGGAPRRGKLPEGSAVAVHRLGRRRRLAAGARDLRAAPRHRDVRRRGRMVRGQPGDVAFAMGGYRMSKVVMNQYVAADLRRSSARRGVRLNCLNPGPTATAMMPAFEDAAGKDDRRERARRDPPVLAARGTGLADGLPEQPALQLRHR